MCMANDTENYINFIFMEKPLSGIIIIIYTIEIKLLVV